MKAILAKEFKFQSILYLIVAFCFFAVNSALIYLAIKAKPLLDMYLLFASFGGGNKNIILWIAVMLFVYIMPFFVSVVFLGLSAKDFFAFSKTQDLNYLETGLSKHANYWVIYGVWTCLQIAINAYLFILIYPTVKSVI